MSKFTEAIEHNWPDYIISSGASSSCDVCVSVLGLDRADYDDDGLQEKMYELDEGSFSWCECESCGSTLGGDRRIAHAIHKDAFGPNATRPDDVHHIGICNDCLVFHANGDEPETWE